MSPAAAVVNTPELVTMTVLPAFIAAFTVRFVPVNAKAPLSPVVPPKVVVPVPACWVKLAAVTEALAVKSLAEVILIAPNTDEAPTSPVIEISPVPAMSDKPRAVPSLLIVLEKLMLPAPDPVERIRSPPVTVTGPLTLIVPPAALEEPLLTSPAILIAAPVRLINPPTPVPTPDDVVVLTVSVPCAFRVIEPPSAVPAVLL